MARRIDVIAALDGLVSPGALQDVFLLFCNSGRRQTVTLSLTDTMYNVRALTKGMPEAMSKTAFLSFVRALPDVAESISTDAATIFTNNVGYSSKKVFELSFDQWLDALADLSVARYPMLDVEAATRALGEHHLRPYIASKFVDDEVEAGEGDGASVMTGRNRSLSRRMSRIVLTDKGTAISSGATGTQASVGARVGVGIVVQATEAPANSGSSVIAAPAPMRRMSTRFAPGTGPSTVIPSPSAVPDVAAPLSARGAGNRMSIFGGPRMSVASSPLTSPPLEPPRASLASSFSPPISAASASASEATLQQQYSPLPSHHSNGRAPEASDGSPVQSAPQMKEMIRSLIEVVEALQQELTFVRVENDRLRMQVQMYEGAAGMR